MDADAQRVIDALQQKKLLDETVVVYTRDNGWQMPRGLANCYNSGTREPTAIRWGDKLTAGRKADEFISLADFAPTFLAIAGVKPSAGMTGVSFLNVLVKHPPATARDHVFIERERPANVRRGNLRYPVRGIRTRDFLYLWNIRPDRWPAGDPKAFMAVGDYGDVDASRAKEFILTNADRPEITPFFALNFGKRPEEELFDLRKDAGQVTHVSLNPAYSAAKQGLRARHRDPRVDPSDDASGTYPYFGGRVVIENGNPVTGKARLAK